MADDNSAQSEDPFRGHLTIEELQKLLNGEMTVDEIFAERDSQSVETPEDEQMKDDSNTPEVVPDEEKNQAVTDEQVEKKATAADQTEADQPKQEAVEPIKPKKLEVTDDTDFVEQVSTFSVHEMADPFTEQKSESEAEHAGVTPLGAELDMPTPFMDELEPESKPESKPELATDQADSTPATDEKVDASADEQVPVSEPTDDADDYETFEAITPEPAMLDGEISGLEFTEPQPPTYYAGSSFIDQTGGLGATSVIPIQKPEKVTDARIPNPSSDELGAAVATPSDEAVVDDDADTSSRMLRGSFWMTAGSLASRLLGALYVIPWMAMLGYTYANQANAVYGQGYQIYSLALMVATAGLPNVLARLVAEYASKKQFNHVQQVFKQSLILGGIMGIVAAGVIYFFAGPLGQGDPNVARVIRSLAPAVLIIPGLAMMRGFMQGFEFMAPSALSQFVEQVVRVAYMLGMTYWMMIAGHGNWVDATAQSTFAAFWGALAAIVVLVISMMRRRAFFSEQAKTQVPSEPINTMSLMGKMVRQSIPVILAGSAIAIAQLMDQYTFANVMKRFTDFSDLAITNMFAQFAVNSNKLVMLAVSLAVGMAETTLPMLARAREIGSRENIANQIQFAFKLLSFVLVPASLGMAAVAKPLYLLFYTTNDAHNGILVLQYASFTALVLGAYMVVLAIYQGLNQLRYTVKLLAIILGIKLVTQVPAILLLDGMGPLFSTMVAFAAGLWFALRRITKEYKINWHNFAYSLSTIIFWSLVMYVVAALLTALLGAVLPSGKIWQLLILMIAGGVGAMIYAVAALKTDLAKDVLGARVERLAAKLPF